MRRRERTPRPIISAPIGPVKNSRGADLVRSETLLMVDSLKDCEISTLLGDQIHSPSTTTSRKVSAGFSNTGPLSSTSTVASSEIVAHPTIQYPSRIHSLPSPQKRRRSFLGASSIPKPFRSGPSARFSLSSGISDAFTLDENVPMTSLDDMGASLRQRPRVVSKLPKSRTMNALQEIKSSISRPSLGIRSNNASGHTTSSRKTSSSSTATSPLLPCTPSGSRLPSFASISSSQARSTTSLTSEPLPGQVDQAKSSAFWTGRFMAVRDRFLTEEFNAELSDLSRDEGPQETDPSSETPYSSLYKRTAHLPHSTTMSALRNVPSNPTISSLSDDDTLHLRVLEHLNDLCKSQDARRSLYAWQQAFARREGRPCLLPRGGSMETRGIMAKIFGGGAAHRIERHSLHAIDRAGKRTISEAYSMTSSHTKRLTVF